jgi:hypothetical protein
MKVHDNTVIQFSVIIHSDYISLNLVLLLPEKSSMEPSTENKEGSCDTVSSISFEERKIIHLDCSHTVENASVNHT